MTTDTPYVGLIQSLLVISRHESVGEDLAAKLNERPGINQATHYLLPNSLTFGVRNLSENLKDVGIIYHEGIPEPGIGLLSRIHDSFPTQPLIYMYQQDPDTYLLDGTGLVDKVYESGASGFILRSSANIEQAVQKLERAVQSYLENGERYTSLEYAYLPIDKSEQGVDVTSLSIELNSFDGLLSKREIQVLEFLAEGASNKRISEALFISPSTVHSHVRHIQHKLRTANRTQSGLLARAMLTGKL